jgi:hypothetical protein
MYRAAPAKPDHDADDDDDQEICERSAADGHVASILIRSAERIQKFLSK